MKKKLIEQIDKALLMRKDEYPRRGPGWELLNKRIKELLLYVMNNWDDINVEIKDEWFQVRDDPIFIVGPMKSGTSLLQQLFDTHCDLYTIPGDCHLFNHYLNKYDFAGENWFFLEKWLNILINPDGKPSFWSLGKDIDQYVKFASYRDAFMRKFAYMIDNVGLAYFLSSVHSASVCLYGECRRFVEKTPGEEFYAKNLLSVFPNAKFIHVVRNPIRTIVSLVKLGEHRGLENLQAFMNGIKGIIDSFIEAEKNESDNYKIVRYEDITSNTRDVMKELSSFVGIDFYDSLCVPTRSGEYVESNSMFDERKVSGKVLKESNEDVGMYIDKFLTEEQVNYLKRLYNIVPIRKRYDNLWD